MTFDTRHPDRPDLAAPPEIVKYVEHLEDLLDDVNTDAQRLAQETGSALEDVLGALPQWGSLDTDDNGMVEAKVAEAMIGTLVDAAETLLKYANPVTAAYAWEGIGNNSEVQMRLLLRLPPATRAELSVKALQKAFRNLAHNPKVRAVFIAFFKDGATGRPEVDLAMWRVALERKPELALQVVEMKLPFNELISSDDILPLTDSTDGTIRSRAILATAFVGNGSVPEIEPDKPAHSVLRV